MAVCSTNVADNRVSNSALCTKTMSFAFTYAVRFFTYCIFCYYFYGMKGNNQQRTQALA